MSRRRVLQVLGVVVALAVVAAGLTFAFRRYLTPQPAAPATTNQATAPAATAHITATLFYAAQDGRSLVPVRREVPLADNVVAQARQILAAQLQPAPPGYLSVIPAGTSLRALYLTDKGDAFVDLSPEISTAHPGGSFSELLTVYAVVNAVTANLPAVQRVQLLLDGKEADTIAGHVDIRRPLTRDNTLVKEP